MTGFTPKRRKAKKLLKIIADSSHRWLEYGKGGCDEESGKVRRQRLHERSRGPKSRRGQKETQIGRGADNKSADNHAQAKLSATTAAIEPVPFPEPLFQPPNVPEL
jgi:hypothetical protein